MSVHTYLWQSAADRRLCSYLLRVAQVKAVGLAEVVFTQNIDTSGTAKANVFKHGKSIVLSKKAPFLKLKISL